MGLEGISVALEGNCTVALKNADLSNGPPNAANQPDERTLVSSALENDEEFIRRETEIEACRAMIIEHIVESMDEAHADILLTYMRLIQEQYETAICMADMIAYDLKTVKNYKSEY